MFLSRLHARATEPRPKLKLTYGASSSAAALMDSTATFLTGLRARLSLHVVGISRVFDVGAAAEVELALHA